MQFHEPVELEIKVCEEVGSQINKFSLKEIRRFLTYSYLRAPSEPLIMLGHRIAFSEGYIGLYSFPSFSQHFIAKRQPWHVWDNQFPNCSFICRAAKRSMKPEGAWPTIAAFVE